MTLGERINTERKNRGLSQDALADACGVSLRTIQRIENNTSVPRPYTLKVLADALQVELDELATALHDHTTESAEAVARLNLINASALVGLVIPLLNCVAPFLVWRAHRHLPLVHDKGKRIISFQLSWTLLTALLLPVTHFVHYAITGAFVTGRVPMLLVVYLLMLLVNGVLIIKTALQLRSANTDIYRFSPVLF